MPSDRDYRQAGATTDDEKALARFMWRHGYLTGDIKEALIRLKSRGGENAYRQAGAETRDEQAVVRLILLWGETSIWAQEVLAEVRMGRAAKLRGRNPEVRANDGVDGAEVGKDVLGGVHIAGTVVLSAFGLGAGAKALEGVEGNAGVLPDWAHLQTPVLQPASQGASGGPATSQGGSAGQSAAQAMPAEGSLIKIPNDPHVWHVTGGQRRWVTSEQEFARRGYQWPALQIVSAQVLQSIPVGADEGPGESPTNTRLAAAASALAPRQASDPPVLRPAGGTRS